MFDAAPEPLSVPSYLRGYIQPTFNHGLRIWWAFFWRTTLISMVITFGINFGLRVIYEHTNVPGNLIRPLMRFSPYVVSYTVALFIMEYILRKRFRDFRTTNITSVFAPISTNGAQAQFASVPNHERIRQ